MVIDWLAGLLSGIVTGLLGLFPDLPDASWLVGGVGGAVGTISSKLSGFGAWVPFPAVGQALTFVLAVLVVAVAIKIIRIVASFFTAGGGSAA